MVIIGFRRLCVPMDTGSREGSRLNAAYVCTNLYIAAYVTVKRLVEITHIRIEHSYGTFSWAGNKVMRIVNTLALIKTHFLLIAVTTLVRRMPCDYGQILIFQTGWLGWGREANLYVHIGEVTQKCTDATWDKCLKIWLFYICNIWMATHKSPDDNFQLCNCINCNYSNCMNIAFYYTDFSLTKWHNIIYNYI